MAINNEPTIQPRTVTGIFTNYIAKVLPLAFDDSMSYYECLCALLNYINDTVVPDLNNVNDGLGELQEFYEELQSYVNDYFENLDVQEEINNKLDAMASSGQLSQLIQPLFNTYTSEINSNITQQNNKINQLEDTINAVANGTPLVANSTAGMTDTSKIYVNTSDGKWYYYDGDSWEIGGTYQSTGIDNNSITINNFNSNLKNDFTELYNKVDISSIEKISGKFILASNGSEGSYSSYSHTSYISCSAGEKYISLTTGLATNIAMFAFYNDSNTFVSSVAFGDNLNGRPVTVPTGATKMMLSYATARDIELIKLNKIKVNGLNELNYNDMDQVFKNTFTPAYNEIDPDLWVDNTFYNTTGMLSEMTGFKSVELEVIPSEKIILTGSSESYQVLYQYYLNGALVNYPSNTTSFVQHTDVELTIPDGVYLLHISVSKTHPNKNTKEF